MTTLKQLKTPVFAAEGILHLPSEEYQLTVRGLTGSDQTLSYKQLRRELPQASITMRLTSVSGWSVRANWNGTLWKDFIQMLQPKDNCNYALFSSADTYTTCIGQTDLLASTAMLVWGVDGEPLEDEYGGPYRLIVPNLWGYKSCKWLKQIDFQSEYVSGFWEVRGYSDSAEIEAGQTYDVNSGCYRQIPGGEVIDE